jgi:hypothetical protein
VRKVLRLRFSTTLAATPLPPSLWQVSRVLQMWGARFVWREGGRENESVLRFGKGAGVDGEGQRRGGVFLSRSMYGVEVFVKQHASSGPRNTTPFLQSLCL